MAKEIEEVSVCQMANQPIQINGICAQIRPQVNIKKQTKYEISGIKYINFLGKKKSCKFLKEINII